MIIIIIINNIVIIMKHTHTHTHTHTQQMSDNNKLTKLPSWSKLIEEYSKP